MSSATLKSIAKATGFSITTVSRALGGFDDVNEDTRRLIIEEALKQGYTPNLHARALQGQRVQTIGLVIEASRSRDPDPFFSEFLTAIGSEAATAGFDLLLIYSPSDREFDTYRRLVVSRRVDGLIITSTRAQDPRIDYLLSTGTPFVVFGRSTQTEPYFYIDTDGTSGQHTLTEHFIAYGHRRIAYITPPAEFMYTHYRLQGFRQAMVEHELPIDENLVIEGAMSERSGKEKAEALLSLPTPPTAIMTGNDLSAFGVMNAVRNWGLQVGGDIAVGGFDNIPTAEHVHPGLTTIRQPIFQTAQRLTQILLDLIAGKTPEQNVTLLDPKLIVRASSGSPRRDP
jgi:LacI family transcriptional regulator, galactose operon repressor